MRKATGNNEYEGISESSTDEEKLSTALSVLEGNVSPVNIKYGMLYIPYEKEKLFNAKLKNTGFVDVCDTDNSYNPGFKLNDAGHLMMEKYGSYLEYIKDQNNVLAKKEQEDKNVEFLKLESLVLSVNKLRSELSDYGVTKRRVKRSEIYAILALIVSVLLLVQRLISSKHG